MIRIALLALALSVSGCALLKDDGWNELVFSGIAHKAPLNGGDNAGHR